MSTDSRYQIYNLGRIYSPRTKRYLKFWENHKGYSKITLYNGRFKNHFVHRLVMETFVGKVPEGLEINHKNGVKNDNRLENLEYLTPEENREHYITVLSGGGGR